MGIEGDAGWLLGAQSTQTPRLATLGAPKYYQTTMRQDWNRGTSQNDPRPRR